MLRRVNGVLEDFLPVSATRYRPTSKKTPVNHKTANLTHFPSQAYCSTQDAKRDGCWTSAMHPSLREARVHGLPFNRVEWHHSSVIRPRNLAMLSINSVSMGRLAIIALTSSMLLTTACTKLVDESNAEMTEKPETSKTSAPEDQEEENTPGIGSTGPAGTSAGEVEGSQTSESDTTNKGASEGEDSKPTSSKMTDETNTPTSGEETEETVECENGAQRACQELPNGTPVSFPTPEPKGACKRGVSTCSNNEWGRCEGTVGPEPKDTCDPGNDANCNGIANDHCDCTPGQTKPCGSAVGECKQGKVTCDPSGTWSKECIGEIKPSAEKCDGANRDEDCNGLADLQDPKCECIDGQRRKCQLFGKRGDCRLGSVTCKSGRFDDRACVSRFRPASEQCGARRDDFGSASGDEDCDGKTDETDRQNPNPRGCQLYFQDEDGDNFGAMGPSVAEDPRRATHGCLCPGVKIPSSWTKGPATRANKDCGDCVVGGNIVYPNNTQFYTSPSSCLEQLGSRKVFDYNCDGISEKEKPNMIDCTMSGTECIQRGGYWGGENGVPACGQSGLPGGCGTSSALPPQCVVVTLNNVTQGCR